VLDQITLDLIPLGRDVAPSEERVRPEQHPAEVSSVSGTPAARGAIPRGSVGNLRLSDHARPGDEALWRRLGGRSETQLDGA
jgi:hypothetical protein